jgi:hypothetical protein
VSARHIEFELVRKVARSDKAQADSPCGDIGHNAVPDGLAAIPGNSGRVEAWLTATRSPVIFVFFVHQEERTRWVRPRRIAAVTANMMPTASTTGPATPPIETTVCTLFQVEKVPRPARTGRGRGGQLR